MRYAIFADIHSNLEAFEAVLRDIETEDVDACFCVGDVVDYGADPDRCAEKVRNLAITTVCGNHDAAVCGNLDISAFNSNAQASVMWTREVLTESNHAFLSALPYTYEFDDFILVHGSLNSPSLFRYILNKESAKLSFDVLKKKLCFVGHSHVPCFFYISGEEIFKAVQDELSVKDKERCIVNVGSVGQPRDGDARAAYCVYDSEQEVVKLKRIEYDHQKAARKIIEKGLPGFLAERLSMGR